MKKMVTLFLIVLLGFTAVLFAAQKSVKLTTYYPAPYGEYNNLKSQTLNLGTPGASPKGGVLSFVGSNGVPQGTWSAGSIYYDAGPGKFKYTSDGTNWQTFYSGTMIRAYNLADIDQYVAGIQKGTATVVDNTNNTTAKNKDKYKKGGFLLGGTVAGYSGDQCTIVVDGVSKTFQMPLSEIEELGGGTDINIGTIPGPIRFEESIKVTFRDNLGTGDWSKGMVYVVWDE